MTELILKPARSNAFDARQRGTNGHGNPHQQCQRYDLDPLTQFIAPSVLRYIDFVPLLTAPLLYKFTGGLSLVGQDLFAQRHLVLPRSLFCEDTLWSSMGTMML